MITAELMGGLGNQMYILFTLIAYSLNNKIPFYIENKPITVGSRTVTYWNNIFANFAKFIKPEIPIQALIKERSWNYSQLPSINKDITGKLIGYFLSFKYFESQKENILKLMNFDEIKMPYTNLYDYTNSVSLHFRLGDYKGKEDWHPILPLVYYENALKMFVEKTNINNWQVLYFCEDEDVDHINIQIASLSQQLPTFHFLRADPTLADWEQMIVMSLCKHNIIANSSFSLWASYLNTNEEKLVFCPKTISGIAIKETIKTEDKYPNNYIVL